MRNLKKASESIFSCLVSPAFVWVAIGCIFFQFLVYLLAYPSHDWDLDAFLYLGSRLDQGELLYTKDFETKLPLVQYLFWIPYKFGGIGAWRILTFLFATTAAVISAHIFANISEKKHKNLSYLYVVVFLLLVFSLPGGSSSHISIVSSACILLSIALVVNVNERSFINGEYFAGVLIAIAVSIRPNYGYILPCYGILILHNGDSMKNFIIESYRLSCGFLFVVFCQFVPYFFNHEYVDMLFEGLKALGNYSGGTDFNILLRKQFVDNKNIVNLFQDGRFFLSLYILSIATAVLIFRHRVVAFYHKKFWSIMLFCVVSIVMVDVSFLRTHYWSHYGELFLPFFTLMFVDFIATTANGYIINLLKIVLIVLFVSVPVRSIAHSCKVIINDNNFDRRINNRNMNKTVFDMITVIKNNGYSFYVPFNTNYHRVFGESRLGDGHPAILDRVLGGKRLGGVNMVNLYSDHIHENPCLVFDESGKDFIIFDKNEAVTSAKVERCVKGSLAYANLCVSYPSNSQFLQKFCANSDRLTIYTKVR